MLKVGDKVRLYENGDIYEIYEKYTLFGRAAYNARTANGNGIASGPEDIFIKVENEIKDNISHKGHEVVPNIVLGKTFNYCRNCKIEVA